MNWITQVSGPTDHAHDRMRPSDAVLWDIEQDPVLRSTITAVAILDRAPDWDRLAERVEYATRVIPRLRQRVVVPPLRIGLPRWVVDPGFDRRYHLRRVNVAPSGSLRDVLELVEPLATTPFDRSRPLWEFTLVEGLSGGQAAFVQKVHHTITDGVGGIELALSILDARRDAPNPAMPDEPAPGATDALSAASDALLGATRAAIRTTATLPQLGARAAFDAVRHPVGSSRRTGAMISSIGRMVAPVPRSATPLLADRSLQRRFGTIDLPLASLKAAAHAADGTTNDAFLAAVVDGLRRYAAHHGLVIDELRLTMPINLRHEGDDPGGNHFAPVRFVVPVGISDPRERMRRLGEIARQWRAEPALAHSDAIAVVLDRLPTTVTTGLFGSMLKRIDAVVTNVPGAPSRSYLAGSELVREYAFAPPSGAAVNVALVSHVGTACVGVVSDGLAVPDPDVLVACLVEGFDDILSTVGGHAVGCS